MTRRINLFFTLVIALLFQSTVVHAHFLWLVQTTNTQGEQLHVYFGEVAEPDDLDLLDRVADVKVWAVDTAGKTTQLKLKKGSDSLLAKLDDTTTNSLYVLQRDLGVMARGGESFLLRYYAKTGPALTDPAWKSIDCTKRLALDLVPEKTGDDVRITATWHGKPVVGAQVKAAGPDMEDFEGVTDKRGQVTFTPAKGGLHSIRVRHIEVQGGESNGEKFTTTRHYSTLALRVASSKKDDAVTTTPAKSLAEDKSVSKYQPIPAMVTSFGAAIVGDSLYVYGGHTGRAHSYSAQAQARTLRRLDLQHGKWESLSEGPGLQGLALVARKNKLYRLGGFTAKNKEGEAHDLWSQAGVACYDIATRQWRELSPMPEPRSSFDAAVLGDKLYVVGGWKMAGEGDTVWHKSAIVLDLAAPTPEWKALPEPSFQRRALSVAAHQGKIFAIGGMQEEGGPTTRVDIYDVEAGKWSEGPSLHGEGMDGFGSSAFATGDRLYVSTYSGKLQRLAEDGKSWEVVKELERDRFFHRMLPLSKTQLISVGGASMKTGKFKEVDVIDVR